MVASHTAAFDPKPISTTGAVLETGRDAPHVNLVFMALRAIGPAPTKAKTRIAKAAPATGACVCVSTTQNTAEIMFHFDCSK